MDDDDIFYANHLEVLKADLKNKDVVYSDATRAVYSNSGNIIKKYVPYSIDYDRNKLLIGNIAPINCFTFKKSLYRTNGNV